VVQDGLLDSVFDVSEGQLISADILTGWYQARVRGQPRENLAESSISSEIEEPSSACSGSRKPRVPTPALAGLVGSVRADAERDYQACQEQAKKQASADTGPSV